MSWSAVKVSTHSTRSPLVSDVAILDLLPVDDVALQEGGQTPEEDVASNDRKPSTGRLHGFFLAVEAGQGRSKQGSRSRFPGDTNLVVSISDEGRIHRERASIEGECFAADFDAFDPVAIKMHIQRARGHPLVGMDEVIIERQHGERGIPCIAPLRPRALRQEPGRCRLAERVVRIRDEECPQGECGRFRRTQRPVPPGALLPPECQALPVRRGFLYGGFGQVPSQILGPVLSSQLERA